MPVETVSWHDALEFCAALTMRDRAAGGVPAGHQYRLPTEAEWEYCCRAGTTTEFWVGSNLSCGQEKFGYSYHSNASCGPSSTAAVGRYAANGFGLHDMLGNVSEWCLDSWDAGANYPAGGVTDPFVASGPVRVIRGGSWGSYSYSSRSAFRSGSVPGDRGDALGFRVVLAPVLVQ